MVALERCRVRLRSSSDWKVPCSRADAMALGADAFRYVAKVDKDAACRAELSDYAINVSAKVDKDAVCTAESSGSMFRSVVCSRVSDTLGPS